MSRSCSWASLFLSVEDGQREWWVSVYEAVIPHSLVGTESLFQYGSVDLLPDLLKHLA